MSITTYYLHRAVTQNFANSDQYTNVDAIDETGCDTS